MNLDTLEKKRKHLRYLLSRLEKIQLYGDDAVSAYDLLMGYDSNYYLHPNSVLQNQINSLTLELLSDEKYEPELIQAQLIMQKNLLSRPYERRFLDCIYP